MTMTAAGTMLLLAGVALGQTVSGQTSTGAPPQTASAILGIKKVPKLTLTLSAPQVPLCSTLSSTSTANACIDPAGILEIVAGTSVSCTATVNIAPAAVATVALSSSDTTQFTVPASTTIAAGSTTSSSFTVSATTP